MKFTLTIYIQESKPSYVPASSKYLCKTTGGLRTCTRSFTGPICLSDLRRGHERPDHGRGHRRESDWAGRHAEGLLGHGRGRGEHVGRRLRGDDVLAESLRAVNGCGVAPVEGVDGVLGTRRGRDGRPFLDDGRRVHRDRLAREVGAARVQALG